MNALACFQFPAIIQRLLNVSNDPELVNYLSDALFRCKTRRVNALLSIVIRMLLWQTYLCGKTLSNSMEFDHFDCSEVRKFYALELIRLAKQIPNHVITKAHTIIDGTDDFIKFRWHHSIQKTQTITKCNSIDSKNKDQTDYFYGILKINRTFGCTSFESCLNPNAPLKRIIGQIIDDSNKLKVACEKNPTIDLKQFSSEINYVCDLFNCLQNEM